VSQPSVRDADARVAFLDLHEGIGNWCVHLRVDLDPEAVRLRTAECADAVDVGAGELLASEAVTCPDPDAASALAPSAATPGSTSTVVTCPAGPARWARKRRCSQSRHRFPESAG
jgi:hypothetical protein